MFDTVVGADVSAETLMARIARGDEPAFAVLYDQLAPTVYGIVRRVVRDPAHSEEVTQEVFVELWRKAGRFDSTRGRVRSWAVTIAHRRAVDRVRSEQSLRDRQQGDWALPPSAPDSPADAVLDAFDRDRARQALSELSDVQRQALELVYFDGLTHVEAAERLDVALGTIKTRIRQGLIRLRTLVDVNERVARSG
jgi:RNA polymerase sigma-70 factor (ECF subfamily)